MVRWADYRKTFVEHYAALKGDLLAHSLTEFNGGPLLKATPVPPPPRAPWKVEWGVLYDDGYYFRVKECFNALGYPYRGAGVREHFSFHYGKAHPKLHRDGYPHMKAHDTPVAALRIDNDRNLTPHIHLNSAEHIYQERVIGYSIRDADMYDFLRAVAKHRNTKEPLHELLGITIVP